MLFFSHHPKTEKVEIEKAKRQLLFVGVFCIALVVFILWFMGLDNTFKRNRQQYKAVLDQNAQEQLGQKLQALKKQLGELK